MTDRKLYVVGANVNVVDSATNTVVDTYANEVSQANYAEGISPNGRYIVSGGWDQPIGVWDTTTHSGVGQLAAPGGYHYSGVTFSADSTKAQVWAMGVGYAEIDLATCTLITTWSPGSGDTTIPAAVAQTSDHTTAFFCISAGNLSAIRLSDNSVLWTTGFSGVYWTGMSEDGTTLYVQSPGHVNGVDPATGTVMWATNTSAWVEHSQSCGGVVPDANGGGCIVADFPGNGLVCVRQNGDLTGISLPSGATYNFGNIACANGNAYIFGFPTADGYLVVVDLSSLTWTENIPITDSYPVGGVFLEAPSGPPLGSWSTASQSNWSGQGPVV